MVELRGMWDKSFSQKPEHSGRLSSDLTAQRRNNEQHKRIDRSYEPRLVRSAAIETQSAVHSGDNIQRGSRVCLTPDLVFVMSV